MGLAAQQEPALSNACKPELDADTLALHAAQHNLPYAAKLHLSDGWHGVSKRERFDWIVSNPPVHLGIQTDFRILTDLIRQAPRHLLPGGHLWLVAQTYIPVGRMLAQQEGAAGSFREACAVYDDGRFVVWRATLGVAEGGVSLEQEDKQPSMAVASSLHGQGADDMTGEHAEEGVDTGVEAEGEEKDQEGAVDAPLSFTAERRLERARATKLYGAARTWNDELRQRHRDNPESMSQAERDRAHLLAARDLRKQKAKEARRVAFRALEAAAAAQATAGALPRSAKPATVAATTMESTAATAPAAASKGRVMETKKRALDVATRGGASGGEGVATANGERNSGSPPQTLGHGGSVPNLWSQGLSKAQRKRFRRKTAGVQ